MVTNNSCLFEDDDDDDHHQHDSVYDYQKNKYKWQPTAEADACKMYDCKIVYNSTRHTTLFTTYRKLQRPSLRCLTTSLYQTTTIQSSN